ncbi:MAG: hypothetical protein IPH31_22845 [Lewinellaceae bacterium]|nr:hypothetical protein [Lewinellaceae bacterium]
MQTIAIRGQLTDERKSRGGQEGQEYAILTAEISKATFGITPSEYMKHKSLKRENLRDHMTNLELIFTMLGEEQTKQEAVKDDAQGFVENKNAAVKGGSAAGDALNAFERRTGSKVVTSGNFNGKSPPPKSRSESSKKKTKRNRDDSFLDFITPKNPYL